MTDFRALCAELAQELDHYYIGIQGHDRSHPLAAKARAALAQPEPKAPVPNATLTRIAEIAHAGALIGFTTETEALVEIRRLTQPFVGDRINRLQNTTIDAP